MVRWCLLISAMMISVGSAQQVLPSERFMPAFRVHGASRLAALARVGSLTQTSMLVEAGDMPALQAVVSFDTGPTTVRDAVHLILGSRIPYTLRDEGRLLIVSTATVHDRMLALPLGPFHFTGGEYSSLDGPLEGALRKATGCPLMGWAWAGPETAEGLPEIQLANATFEKIVARTADGPEAGIWIVQTKRRPHVCMGRPAFEWQFGVYGFGAGFSTCQEPLRSSAGPKFLAFSPGWHAFPEPCDSADKAFTKAPALF